MADEIGHRTGHFRFGAALIVAGGFLVSCGRRFCLTFGQRATADGNESPPWMNEQERNPLFNPAPGADPGPALSLRQWRFHFRLGPFQEKGDLNTTGLVNYQTGNLTHIGF